MGTPINKEPSNRMLETLRNQQKTIQDYLDGKTIEYKRKDIENSIWRLNTNPLWEFSHYDYRVKPETKVVPYSTLEELDEAMIKHNCVIKGKDRNIRFVARGWSFDYDNRLRITIGNEANIHTDGLLEFYTWLDGSPCGKEVAE